MSKLPTESIFHAWLSQAHPELNGLQINNLSNIYRFFRSRECTSAARLNEFIKKQTAPNDRQQVARLVKEFINILKTNQQTIKPKYHVFKF